MLDDNIIKSIHDYAKRDLPDDHFYSQLFLFISDNFVRELIIKEYKNIRFVYKILEGIQASDDLLYFEAKTQIIMYASIEEAALSWVLFEYFSNSPEVEGLLKTSVYKEYCIPPAKKNQIASALLHDSRDIIPCFKTTINVKKEKVRFDSKVNAAYKLGIISEKMKNDLIDIYEYRNTIHLEAAIKKNLDYTLKMSKKAYRRVEGLNIELSDSLRKLGLFN